MTLPSLNGKTVEETAIDIGRSYKLGAVGKNNGMVYLTALNERRMRIEQGLGLEDKIRVSTLETIMNNDILPYYKQNKYELGIRRGTYMLARTVAQAEGVNLTEQGVCPSAISYSNTSRNSDNFPWWFWPFIILAGIFSPRRRTFGSGFGGFGGGGGFGGSGCSGSS